MGIDGISNAIIGKLKCLPKMVILLRLSNEVTKIFYKIVVDRQTERHSFIASNANHKEPFIFNNVFLCLVALLLILSRESNQCAEQLA